MRISSLLGRTGPSPSIERVAPELVGLTNWLNTRDGMPLTLAELRGSVVAIDFWTSACINCVRTRAGLVELDERRRSDGLTIIGVHAPEFGWERDPTVVLDAVRNHGIGYPVAQDNRMATWNAFRNHFWPAFYLIGRDGRVRFTHFGEGRERAKDTAVLELLAESAPV